LKFAHLSDRSLIEVSGDDAEHFLENLVTCKVEGLGNSDAAFGGLLTPQGKILFDFFILRQDSTYFLDVARDLSLDLLKRLTFYKLRAKVTLEEKKDMNVTAFWGETQVPGSMQFPDPRHAKMGLRDYSNREPEGQPGNYDDHRIAVGVPQGGQDFQYGEAYPHEVLMDQFGGVDFKKGCYVGQEVVSRMQHRGTAKKRIIPVTGNSALPQPGTAVSADGKPAGTLGSVSGNKGLALLRLDRIASANTVLCGETEIQPGLQNWVSFQMPGKE